MGQVMGKITEPLINCGGSVSNMFVGRQKRKRAMNPPDTDSKTDSEEGHIRKKKKLLTTTQYIYQALFKEQKNSDISVMALGKVWKLHKVYLCQSPYFYSMFNGSWRESQQDFVHIKILDTKITLEALESVFGSMYSDEIEIDPKDVVSVLATATLFHLDSIIDKCAEVMVENIAAETAVSYYESACEYGCLTVKKATFEWLEINFLYVYSKDSKLLREIGIELMSALIASPDLYVMQTEFSLYTLLRTWIYLRMHPDSIEVSSAAVGTPQEASAETPQKPHNKHQQQEWGDGHHNNSQNVRETPIEKKIQTTAAAEGDVIQLFFSNYSQSQAFLNTVVGQQYLKPFQVLRTQYLTNHHMDLKIVLNDNIIPKEWVHNHVLSHWASVLKVDHHPEDGPQNLEPDEFYKNCMRCGRVLPEPGYQKWRWTGFNFGLDLILIADSRMLTIRRHHRNEHERLLSLQTKRQFMLRVAVSSLNAQRQPVYTQKTDIKSLCLEKNEEMILMEMDPKLVHPLLISVNVLVVKPISQSFKGELIAPTDANTIPISDFGTNCILNRDSTLNDDSAICVVPTPPSHRCMQTQQQHHQSQSHRSASIVSTTSSTSSLGSTTSSSDV